MPNQNDGALRALRHQRQTLEDGTDFICAVHIHIASKIGLQRVKYDQLGRGFPNCLFQSRVTERQLLLAFVNDQNACAVRACVFKPRLENAGADCTRVLVIDESKQELTLCDARLEQAIRKTSAKLIVLDPLQAYLGSDVDMHRANEVRPVLKRLSLMAERTQSAVILIGHMNKAQGLKAGYRGLGSIDFRASARSVLIVGRLKSGDTLRIVAQDKNSLAPEGAAIAFELHPEHGFQWKGFCDATVDNILNGTGQVQTKTMQMEDELRRFLTQPRPAEEVLALAKQLGISERTLKIAKRNLGILSERRADQWLWRLPEQEGKGVTP